MLDGAFRPHPYTFAASTDITTPRPERWEPSSTNSPRREVSERRIRQRSGGQHVAVNSQDDRTATIPSPPQADDGDGPSLSWNEGLPAPTQPSHQLRAVGPLVSSNAVEQSRPGGCSLQPGRNSNWQDATHADDGRTRAMEDIRQQGIIAHAQTMALGAACALLACTVVQTAGYS